MPQISVEITRSCEMLKSASTPVRAAHSKLSFEPISQQIRNKIGNAHLRSPTTQEPARLWYLNKCDS
ncbi:MAG: hypothetical protein DME81_09285 [Verrucomicrobia bacterium]|nr:MAG: hypothetical protein DME81_09285 [Verrucomicrobiota bacterium]